MEVFAEGFQPREVQFAVIEQNPTLLNVTLFRESVRRQEYGASSLNLVQKRVDQKVGLNKDNLGEDKKEEEEDEDSTFFGLPNPLSSLQKNVKSFFDKIPIIG